jgi:signal transduction histidine kinase
MLLVDREKRVQNAAHALLEFTGKREEEILVRPGGEVLRCFHALDDFGIIATVSWLCEEFKTIYSGIRVDKEIEVQEVEVPDILKIVIFRLSQEALNNITKHSRADRVNLSLKRIGAGIELTITDNGVGFNVEHVMSGELTERGLGLAGMKERTTLSGGEFFIESQKGAGTTIRASWERGMMPL